MKRSSPISTVARIIFIVLLSGFYTLNAVTTNDTAVINLRIRSISSMDNEKAIAAFIPLLKQCKEIQYSNGAIRVLNLLGQRYFSIGNNKAMIACEHEAVAIALRSKAEHNQISLLYNNLGICYQSTQRYDSSLFYYQLAVTSQQQFGSITSKSLPYINLGLLYQRLGRTDEATEAYQMARRFSLKEKGTGILAAVLLNIGTLHANDKDSMIIAEQYLRQAIQLVSSKNRPDIVHKAFYSLGVISEKKGLLDEAVQNYEHALKYPMGIIYDDLIPLIGLGQVYISQGKFRKADSILHKGLIKSLAITPPPDYLVDFYRYLGKANKELGNFKIAVHYFDRYVKLSDSLLGKKANERINELEAINRDASYNNELIKEQLVITKQQAIIHRNRLLIVIAAISCIFIALLFFLYLRNRLVRQQKAQQKALWLATLQGEEKIRSEVARDLHNHIAGALTNIRSWLSNLKTNFSKFPEDIDYGGPLSQLDETIKDVRSMAHQLTPELILHQGLPTALRNHCQYVERSTAIKVGFRYLGVWASGHKQLELIIYRNIQELVQNAVKHSGTKKILVQLSCHDELIMVTVQDWGNGMPAELNRSVAGMGLIHVQKSIEQLDGTFEITSQPGKGSSIYFEIDLKTYIL